MIFVAGACLSALGLLCAALLVGAPLELSLAGATAGSGVVLWVLFPVFAGLGWLLMAVAGNDVTASTPTRVVAGILLALALLAAALLVLSAANVVHATQGTAAWWYVLVLAGMAGLVGTAAYGRMAS